MKMDSIRALQGGSILLLPLRNVISRTAETLAMVDFLEVVFGLSAPG
jgi:hypothetical protein